MRGPAFLLVTLLALPAAAQEAPPADPACDPGIATALEAEAAAGVEAEFLVIRDPENGIREPLSILDFSCITDMFNYRAYDIFFDPGRAMDQIMGLLNRRLCSIARDAYRDAIGRPWTPDFIRDIRRLPGVRVPTRRWNLLDDVTGGENLNRLIVEDG